VSLKHKMSECDVLSCDDMQFSISPFRRLQRWLLSIWNFYIYLHMGGHTTSHLRKLQSWLPSR